MSRRFLLCTFGVVISLNAAVVLMYLFRSPSRPPERQRGLGLSRTDVVFGSSFTETLSDPFRPSLNLLDTDSEDSPRYVPCTEQCCFEFRVSNSEVVGHVNLANLFEVLFRDPFLPLSIGGTHVLVQTERQTQIQTESQMANADKRSRTQQGLKERLLLSHLARWNDVRVSGVVTQPCWWEELESVRRVLKKMETEIEIEIEDLFRIDRVVVEIPSQSAESGFVVEYYLHGVVSHSRNPEDRKIDRIKLRRTKFELVDAEADIRQPAARIDEFEILSTGISRSAIVNVGVCISRVPRSVLKTFMESVQTSIRFDQDEIGGRSRLVIADQTPRGWYQKRRNGFSSGLKGFLDDYDVESRVMWFPSEKFVKVTCLQSIINSVPDRNEIVLLLDADMVLPVDFIYRVRSFVELGIQVYLPVCYSQKNGTLLENDAKNIGVKELWSPMTDGGNTEISDESERGENGFWRKFGTGIIAAFRADFDYVGGYDTNSNSFIAGEWGGEDDNLVSGFLFDGYRVFHSAEMGYFHSYHPRRDWRQQEISLSKKK